jgi:hypothetical protein
MAVGDPLMAYLGQAECEQLACERWLLDSPAKRMIAWQVYGDLLVSSGRKVMDIGAGDSSLTRALSERHDYRVIELGAHDPPPGGVVEDWRDTPFDCDLLIAVDLFPNVDQGLAAFLARREGIETRMVLTTYQDRAYRTRRVDADEILTFQAWTWAQTASVLGLRASPPSTSLFANGRQVCLVRLP